MKVILKYPVGANVPEKHTFLHVGIQRGEYVMWLEVEEGPGVLVATPYVLLPTGFATVPAHAKYCGTIIDEPNGTVWHLYDTRG